MKRNIVIIGAGMGGLSAALRLVRLGFTVRVFEARASAGGLASGVEYDGFRFDAGPYILLDRPGLDAAFRALGLDLESLVPLRRLEQVYEVDSGDGAPVRIDADLATTAAGFERRWPGAGIRYQAFIEKTSQIHARLQPLLARPPSKLGLLRSGAWRDAPFLLRSLGQVLSKTGLPKPLVDALGIWTHVAAQTLAKAPSPLAFVPALVHTVGAFYPLGGLAAVPNALAAAAAEAGVELSFGRRIRAIRTRDGRTTGIELSDGELVEADAVVSNASGLGTLLGLVDGVPARTRRHLESLPLQSPGVCAYLAVRGPMRPPYLRFRLPADGSLCRALVLPGVVDPTLGRDGFFPARLVSPLDHAQAMQMGESGQRAHLDALLAESWWREGFDQVRVLHTRTPSTWGSEFHLHRESMNPVMTAAFMRAGRLPHRSPHVKGLYLAGSATHPGQWVSFCARSGLIAADYVREDFA